MIFYLCGTIINERVWKEEETGSHARPSVNTQINMLDTTYCVLGVRWCLHNKWRTNMMGGEKREFNRNPHKKITDCRV